MSCDRCEKLCIKIDIRGPRQLRQSVSLARDGISTGTLRDVSDKFPFPSSPFKEIAHGGPWDDHVNYHFVCTNCQQIFHLEAETYHGSGGSWSTKDDSNATAL